MTSMTGVISIAPDADPVAISKLILDDERWKLARKFGLNDVYVLVDPVSPRKAEIRTQWDDPKGPIQFCLNYVDPFDFSSGSGALATLEQAPKVLVSPRRLNLGTDVQKGGRTGSRSKP